jgi:hypothetical protein
MRFELPLVALLGLSSLVGVPSRGLAEEAVTVAATSKAPSAKHWPRLGLMADVGVPDGAIGSLVVRPFSWFRGYAGGGSNSISRGWRGGFSLIPFGAGPSASLEYGHYQDGDANGLVRRLVGSQFDASPLLKQIGYDYVNAHVGLDFGGKHVVFFLHGGVSMVWAQIHNVNATLHSDTSGTPSTTVVQVGQDPKIKAFGSSFKAGLIVFLM